MQQMFSSALQRRKLETEQDTRFKPDKTSRTSWSECYSSTDNFQKVQIVNKTLFFSFISFGHLTKHFQARRPETTGFTARSLPSDRPRSEQMLQISRSQNCKIWTLLYDLREKRLKLITFVCFSVEIRLDFSKKQKKKSVIVTKNMEDNVL